MIFQHTNLARPIGALLIAAAIGALPSAALAEYPDRPIKLIVPQAAGSATDTVARILAAELSPQLGGQTIIVEDRPGAALTLGMDIVAKSPPDGYTLAVGPIGALAITRHMVKAPYVIERDFQPIGLIVRGHLMLVVSPKSEIKSVKDLIAEAKKAPGKLTNASSSNGSPGHVGGELFKFMTGTEIVHVPYRGGAQATNDLIAGHVQLMFESLNSISPHAKSGAVRGLGVSGPKRSSAFPDMPTIAEAGVPGYDAGTWTSLVGPAGMPKDVVEKLNAALNRAIRSPGFVARFAQIGDEAAGGTPQDLADTIAKDSAKWGDVIQRAGVKLD
ncbi:unnamed protein product [Phaeothamnion confervicola]